ncbi:MAG: hypothetical protein WC256_06415 [Desulfurivibrionaceae bacterium]|jgi:hypothetical protein
MILKLIDFLRDRLTLVIRLSYVGLALVVAWDVLFVSKEHAHTAVEHIPGFWAVFGFIACVVIIIVSKWFGHRGIMTREDYYDN